jgi:hypothetical protein
MILENQQTNWKQAFPALQEDVRSKRIRYSPAVKAVGKRFEEVGNSSSAAQGDAKFRGMQTFVAGLIQEVSFMEGWLQKRVRPSEQSIR